MMDAAITGIIRKNTGRTKFSTILAAVNSGFSDLMDGGKISSIF